MKNSLRLLYFTLFIVFVNITCVIGQDIEQFKKAKPFSIHGSVGAGIGVYNSNEPIKSRDPFSWNIYASLTPTVYGFSFPFSFSITQYSKSYTHPFAQFGISPSYKWATLLLGYRTMEISPLVFAGTNFLGAGVELKPKWFRFGGFYGRLNKAINEDTTYNRRIMPQYARLGYAIKIGAEIKEQSFNFHFFHASDVVGSIHEITDTLNRVRPQTNNVIGASWKFKFFKIVYFDGAIASSLLTQDKRYTNLDSMDNKELPTFFKKVMPINYSSVLSYSGQTSLRLNLKFFNAGIGYKRIQPDYVTLGAPYFLNDVEIITSNAGTRLLKGKLAINASYINQHNNLNKRKAATLQSHNVNLNLYAYISKNFTVNGNVTTVNYFQKNGASILPDSIKLNQMMIAASLSPNFNIQTKTHQHNLGVNFSYTDLIDHNKATQKHTEGSGINSNITYSIYYPKWFVGGNLGVNYNLYQQINSRYHSIGMNLGGNTQLLKDHSLSLYGNFGYYFNKSTSIDVKNNYTFNLGIGYSKSKHRVSLSANYLYTPPVNLNLLNKVNNVPYFVNTYSFSSSLSYSYSF